MKFSSQTFLVIFFFVLAYYQGSVFYVSSVYFLFLAVLFLGTILFSYKIKLSDTTPLVIFGIPFILAIYGLFARFISVVFDYSLEYVNDSNVIVRTLLMLLLSVSSLFIFSNVNLKILHNKKLLLFLGSIVSLLLIQFFASFLFGIEINFGGRNDIPSGLRNLTTLTVRASGIFREPAYALASCYSFLVVFLLVYKKPLQRLIVISLYLLVSICTLSLSAITFAILTVSILSLVFFSKLVSYSIPIKYPKSFVLLFVSIVSTLTLYFKEIISLIIDISNASLIRLFDIESYGGFLGNIRFGLPIYMINFHFDQDSIFALLFGLGHDTPAIVGQYYNESLFIFGTSNNIFVDSLLDFGLVGIAIWVFWYYYLLKKTINIVLHSQSSWDSMPIISAFLSILFVNQINSSWASPSFFLLLSMWYWCYSLSKLENSSAF